MFIFQPVSPWEAWNRFTEGITASDIVWVIIALASYFLVYGMAINQINKDKPATWQTVVKWLAGLGTWGFLMVTFGFYRINQSAPISYVVGGGAFLLALLAVLRFSKKSSDWQKIFSASIIIVIAFGILATFAMGEIPYSYACIFGSLFGIILGMLVTSSRQMPNSSKTGDKSSSWDTSRPDKM